VTRGHRKVHRLLWPVLAAIIALGFTMALMKRLPQENPQSPPVQAEAGK
jgi:hypothetical protein